MKLLSYLNNGDTFLDTFLSHVNSFDSCGIQNHECQLPFRIFVAVFGGAITNHLPDYDAVQDSVRRKVLEEAALGKLEDLLGAVLHESSAFVIDVEQEADSQRYWGNEKGFPLELLDVIFVQRDGRADRERVEGTVAVETQTSSQLFDKFQILTEVDALEVLVSQKTDTGIDSNTRIVPKWI